MKNPISLYFSTFSQLPKAKHQANTQKKKKKNSKSCIISKQTTQKSNKQLKIKQKK